MADVLRTLERATWRLMALENVVGVGRGHKTAGGRETDQECIVVLVKKKMPLHSLSAQMIIPRAVQGVQTDVVEVGELRFLGERTGRMRPACPGVSVGHSKVTAGTLGAVVWDRRTREPFILSNNHVLACATSGRDGRAKRGDPIVQPGAVDGGTVERDQIAVLEKFVPLRMLARLPSCLASNAAERAMNSWLRMTGMPARVEIVARPFFALANEVDVALARPLDPGLVDPRVLELGRVRGVAEPAIGMVVKKSGRTTGVTEGRVTVVDATVTVVYTGNVTAAFRGQFLTGPMAEGGDSGSLLVDEDMRAVGLLFAGSDQSTVYNRMTRVLDALDVDVNEPARA